MRYREAPFVLLGILPLLVILFENPSVNVPIPVCKDWFFFSKRSATEKDNCPIVTALCILMKAAYAFRLHLLKRSACERYVYDFLIL